MDFQGGTSLSEMGKKHSKMSGHTKESVPDLQDQSHQSLTEDSTTGKENTELEDRTLHPTESDIEEDDSATDKDDSTSTANKVIPPSTQEIQKTTSATNQVKHLSLHRDVLSPLAKGVQSVPIFALSPTQAKTFADTGYIKPHTSKAELSLTSSTNVKASGAAALNEKIQILSDHLKKVVFGNKEEPPQEVAVVQEGSDSSSYNSSVGEAVVAVRMQSLSLSALDHQKKETDEGKGDTSNKPANGTSSTLSDTTLLLIEKKSQQPGKTRSRSRSFLKLSASSLKVLSLKSCIAKDQTSSDEDKSGYKSSLDETANARSDKENGAKRKKKQKKKRKWMVRKSTSDTTKESDLQGQPPIKMKPAYQTPATPFTPFSKIHKDEFGKDTPSNFLEWDHFGEDMLPSTSRGENTGDGSFWDEEIAKPGGNIQYHQDMLAILNQIEKEGGPKLTQVIPASSVDNEKLSLLVTILHVYQKKEDIQKMLGVTQEQLWDTQADIEMLQNQLIDMETCNKDVKMENMEMQEKINRSSSQLLQIRSELETKITVLEREIERLEKRLQEQDSTQQKHDVIYKQDDGSQAEIRVLQFQNSQLHDKLCHKSEELENKSLLSQSFTQFAEYLKFRLLLLEEKLITEKQHMHKMIKTVSSANAELVTCNGSTSSVSVEDISVEFGNVPEHENPVTEVKGHIALVQQIIEAVSMEIGHLDDAIKVNLEESMLVKSNLQAELDFLKAEQDSSNQKEIKQLQDRCLQLSEDNDRLEDICIQNAKELEKEKENYQQMSYAKLIKDTLHSEDGMKQQLLAAQEECTQAKNDVTEKIGQVSALQKKCSELMSIENQLRKELEQMRENSQRTIGNLQENQTLAICSLQQQRCKEDTNNKEHEAEMLELKKALQQVCESLKETTKQNKDMMIYCQNLEKEKAEQNEHIKEMECATSESKRQLDYTRMQFYQSQNDVKELHSQYAVKESEKQQEAMKAKQEFGVLRTEHQQYQSQLCHHKRLVEELQEMVRKQEVQHDEVLEELLQRNVEHDKAIEQVKESTKCIQELQEQYQDMQGEKEHLRGMLESHLQRLLKDNQQINAQLHDSQQLVTEQHAKCHKLSEDLKSATDQLTQRDHTIESLRQELAVSVATQKTEFHTRLDENATARANLEGRLCRSECAEKELIVSEHSLQVQLAVQMQTVKMLEEERRKNAGLEQNLWAMEKQLKENNKSLELTNLSSMHHADEIQQLRDAVHATRNQLKELIEDKMHTALLSQLQEKQEITNKLTEALTIMDNYDQYFEENAEEKKNLVLRNQHLEEECKSLTSMLAEEEKKYGNITHEMQELHGKLTRENQEKMMMVQEKERLLDWNQNIFHQAGTITRSLTSISAGQNSELVELKENSGRLATDIQLILRLPSGGGISQKGKTSSIIDKWTNPYGFLTSNHS